ncbi:hypothetical protein B0H34DRAFT_832400 [Crassisporium funariophilum]|nr:hypothetical protein B0H34DRAFT_832400 [Crassisporium funariophilum]
MCLVTIVAITSLHLIAIRVSSTIFLIILAFIIIYCLTLLLKIQNLWSWDCLLHIKLGTISLNFPSRGAGTGITDRHLISYGTCPDWRSHIHCGPSRAANIEKRHCGSKTCKAARQKRDKQATTKKASTILTFFGQAKATKSAVAIPSKIQQAALIHSNAFTPELENTVEELINTTPAPAYPVAAPAPVIMASDHVNVVALPRPVHPPPDRDLLAKLHDLISNIPESIPKATNYDKLAVFGGNSTL